MKIDPIQAGVIIALLVLALIMFIAASGIITSCLKNWKKMTATCRTWIFSTVRNHGLSMKIITEDGARVAF
jgi:hypothetical protein